MSEPESHHPGDASQTSPSAPLSIGWPCPTVDRAQSHFIWGAFEL